MRLNMKLACQKDSNAPSMAKIWQWSTRGPNRIHPLSYNASSSSSLSIFLLYGRRTPVFRVVYVHVLLCPGLFAPAVVSLVLDVVADIDLRLKYWCVVVHYY